MYEVEFTMDPKVRAASEEDFTHDLIFVLDQFELGEDRWDGEMHLELLNEDEGTTVSCPEFIAENAEKAKEHALAWLRATLGPLLNCAPHEVVFENLTWTKS